MANNGTNSPLEAVGGDQVVANPITMITGFTINNAPTSGANVDLTGPHNLTLTGPITFSNSTTNRTIVANTPGRLFTFGSATTPSTFTLSSPGGWNVAFAVAPGGTMVSNVVIQDPATPLATPNTISYISTQSGFGTIVMNGASTYTGNTTFSGGGSNGTGIWQIGVSSVTSGTNLVSGPFGVGQITFNNSNNPPTFQAVGDDRAIANPVLISTSGFWVSSAAGQAHSLSFTGPINEIAGRTVTNNMAPGTTFSLGAGKQRVHIRAWAPS